VEVGTVRLVILFLFAAAAAYVDLRHRRVPNRLVATAAACGVILAACGGLCSLRCAACGLLLGFALLFPAFILGMVGGGDVKSLAVLGLLTGPGLLWVSFLRGAAAGGLAAVVLLAVRRRRRKGREQNESYIKASAWTLPYAGILSLSAALSALLA
jgi:prepilin peptidase CpaA